MQKKRQLKTCIVVVVLMCLLTISMTFQTICVKTISDNYINSNKGERKSFYSDMRIGDKSKNFIQAENEIEKLNIKNKRCYEPIRENATLKECIEFMNSENYGKAKRYYRIIPSKKMGQ